MTQPTGMRSGLSKSRFDIKNPYNGSNEPNRLRILKHKDGSFDE